jgi:hypothetical protein
MVVAGCGTGDPGGSQPPPELTAEIVQLRRDEVLQRVEVAVTNRSGQHVVIETLELRVPGYSGGGVQRKNEPMPPGRRVNLPTPYGDITCTADFRPEVGRPRVGMLVHTADDNTARRVVLRPSDPRDLLHGIAEKECLKRRLGSEVQLGYGPTWRREGTGDATVVHGTLEARLTSDEPRTITQVAGTVLYHVEPEPGAPDPLALLTPEQPTASVPVRVRLARCDGHARGEVKKPYEFRVWLGPPEGEQRAISPPVRAADIAAFRAVCPF